MNDPRNTACSICGAPNPAIAYRVPGLWNRLPESKRRRLWACAEHVPDAEARWIAATRNPAGIADGRSQAVAKPAAEQGGFNFGG